jgi:Lrp/AsnC family leucine-responsive transcriptional regulator
MANSTKPELDMTDWRILEELQRDGRINFAELGRRVALTQPAVADRVRKLERRGIIQGYSARLNLSSLGFSILAFVNVKYPPADYEEYEEILRGSDEILECHHVTGHDCFIAKVAATSMEHLERINKELAATGSVQTTVVYSTPISHRVISNPE